MNRILTLYLLRQLVAAFLFAAGAVTFVVLFTQSFRFLSLVIDNASTAFIFFELLGLSAFTFLPLIVPLGLGVAVMFVYHRLAIDSELAVMRAAGVSPSRLIEPAILLSLVVIFACYVMTLWITPAANRGLVGLEYKMRDSYAVFLAHPGSFNDITDGLTFYANRRGANGALQGILIHDVRHPQTPVTTMAATGQVVDENGQTRLVIFNGRRQEYDRATGKLSELAFDQYVLDLDALRNTGNDRLPELRELRMRDLFAPSPELLKQRGPPARFYGEINSRFAIPLLSVSYALIALASVLAGAFNRRGMGGRLTLGALAIIVTQAVFMSLNGAVARDTGLTFALYGVALLPAPVAFLMLQGENLRMRLSRLLPAFRRSAS